MSVEVFRQLCAQEIDLERLTVPKVIGRAVFKQDKVVDERDCRV